MNNTPRRIQLDRNTDVELAIRDVVRAIEAMPADVRLTDAVVLLDQARNKVADYIDGVGVAAPPPTRRESEGA